MEEKKNIEITDINLTKAETNISSVVENKETDIHKIPDTAVDINNNIITADLDILEDAAPVKEKPKRSQRKKVDSDKLKENDAENEDNNFESDSNMISDKSEQKPKRGRKKKVDSLLVEDVPQVDELADSEETFDIETANKSKISKSKITQKRPLTSSVLTIESKADIETLESRKDVIWHEIHNAYRTRRILTGILSGVEQTENKKSIAVVDYKNLRIIIPIKEMMINLQRSPSGEEYSELMIRQNKILSNMLGAEIDFVVKGIDSKTRVAVGSRKEAMLKKRQLFYLTEDSEGQNQVRENRIVQARVIAVAQKVIRVEVFGVECSILAHDMTWEWMGDAHEHFSVGDEILVKVVEIQKNSLEDITLRVDAKSVTENPNHDNLKKCRIQSKYIGKVTDIRKGVVFIRLTNGVNAVAHSCYDRRSPGKKDDVGFVVTHIDEERGYAVGIITRIIKQNI